MKFNIEWYKKTNKKINRIYSDKTLDEWQEKTRIINSIIRDIVGLAPTIEKMIGPRHRLFWARVDRSLARRKIKNQNTHSIAGAFKNARARATRCFSPPLSCKKATVSEKLRSSL